MNAALTLADAPAAAPLLPRIDRREADADFLQALADGDGSIRALLLDGTLAGAVQTVAGRQAFLPAEAVPVRRYRDEDYDEAHALYAEAFHRMRLATGDFPNSVPRPPSERERRFWAETAPDRLRGKTDFTDTHAKREEDFLCP